MPPLPLPKAFVDRITHQLPSGELEAFLASYEREPHKGLRLNPLKLTRQSFLAAMPFKLTPIPWCQLGFYFDEQERPGRHPYHAAGLYYIQEPSAMAVVEALEPQPGERVLDLCAAPGGKSTQILGYLQNSSLLVANEIISNRAKILAENLERWGARNALITNEPVERLAARLPEFFDRIVVDAPCSGEGMFRKLDEAVDDWSEDKVVHCAAMQKDILDLAAQMLRPGGVLVYSTCTFASEENEEQITSFLESHSDFSLEPVPNAPLLSSDLDVQTALPVQTVRLWPHRILGEGHFIARLRKGQGSGGKAPWVAMHKPQRPSSDLQQLLSQFAADTLNITFDGPFVLFGDQLYQLPDGCPSLDQLKVLRPGWHLGTVKKGRFEPSHALALSLAPGEWQRSVDLSADGAEVGRYLGGEALSVDRSDRGWTVVTVDGYPLGWGKLADGQLKNHYPKGLRQALRESKGQSPKAKEEE